MQDINRIVIHVDNSKFSINIVKKGIYLAKKLDKNISIITVNDTHQFISSVVLEDNIKNEIMIFLNKFKKIGEKFGIKVETHILIGKIDDEIINFVSKKDLLIISYHDKIKGIDKLIGKNASKNIILNAPCSVLVVKS